MKSSTVGSFVVILVPFVETSNIGKLGSITNNQHSPYSLAPEHLFPTWIHDCIDVTKWFASNSTSFNADPSKGFSVGGSSAGGNIAAVLAQLSRLGEFKVPITGQYLSVPFITPLELIPEKYRAELLSPYESLDDPVLNWKGSERLPGSLAKASLR